MVDVEGVEVHPSAIDGRTEEYRAFLMTWGAHCGAPTSVFQGHLNVLIHAELAEMGQYVITATQDMLVRHRPTTTALDRLLADLVAHLEGCDEDDAVALAQRVHRARTVLGFDR